MNHMNDSRTRKRIDVPWQVRIGNGESGRVSSHGCIVTGDVFDTCWMEGAKELTEIAQRLGRLFKGGALERVELQIPGKLRCVVNCSETAATVRVSPLTDG